jgi:hypothetical protein
MEVRDIMKVSNNINANLPLPQFSRDESLRVTRGTLMAGYGEKVDSLRLSATAKRLNLHVSGSAEGTAALWDKKLAGHGFHPVLKLMDEHISKAGKLMERMKTLAEVAQDSAISDADRIELQMQMGRLQHELDFETEKLKGKLMELILGKKMTPSVMDPFENTDAYKMLQRASERLANGGEWDVAEIATPIVKWDDSIGYVVDRVEYEITDDAEVPTVGDILKAKGRSVMDVKAAFVSAAELNKEIEGLVEQRGRLASFIEKNGGNSQDENFRPPSDFLVGFLETLFREMFSLQPGKPKNEQGEYVTIGIHTAAISEPDASAYSKPPDLSQKTPDGEFLETEAVKVRVQLSGRSIGG